MVDVTRRVPMPLREASRLRRDLLFLWIRYVWLVILLLWLWRAVMPTTFLIDFRQWLGRLISLLIPLIRVLRPWRVRCRWRLPLVQPAHQEPDDYCQHHHEE